MKSKNIEIDQETPDEKRLMEMIKTYDVNKDGHISKEEMKEFIL